MDSDTRVLIRTKLRHYLRQFEAESTRRAYGRELLRFIDWCPSKPGASVLYDYRDWLKIRGLSSTTVRWRVTIARAYLRWLDDAGVIAANDVGNARLPKRVRAASPKTLRELQVRRLISTPDRRTWLGRRDAAILVCLARGGLRSGEVCRLKVEDVVVRDDGSDLIVHGKGGHRRRVGLSRDSSSALSDWVRWMLRRDRSARLLFPRSETCQGSALDVHAIRYIVRKRSAEAQMEPVHPHLLRHTAATLAIEAGEPIHRLRDRLGHSSIFVTSQYLHVAEHDPG